VSTVPEPGNAVVTGGNGSLGRVIAARLVEHGWRLIAIDRRAAEAESPSVTDTLLADLSDPKEGAKAIASAAAALGSIDLLINAVGAIHSEPILRFTRGRLSPHDHESWLRTIEANLTAPFLAASAAAAIMARQPRRGVIVNITSISARGNEGQAAYAAAKAGLEAATRVMARELGPLGIRVNAIAPGFIDTPSTRAALAAERLDTLVNATPLRRLGRSEEIANAVEFCWANGFLNGAVIALDGGLAI
jgi:3-oxoacyl-[acyl-carrier protein] reductase